MEMEAYVMHLRVRMSLISGVEGKMIEEEARHSIGTACRRKEEERDKNK